MRRDYALLPAEVRDSFRKAETLKAVVHARVTRERRIVDICLRFPIAFAEDGSFEPAHPSSVLAQIRGQLGWIWN